MKAKGSQFAMVPEGPVYHGSTHGFSTGDTIEPRNDGIHLPKDEKAAFGVTNTSTAGYFAAEQLVPREGQGRLFASVYEVEPKSEYEIHPSLQHDYTKAEKSNKPHLGDTPAQLPESNTMPIDRKGFTVKRHAGFVFPSETPTPDGYHTFQPTE